MRLLLRASCSAEATRESAALTLALQWPVLFFASLLVRVLVVGSLVSLLNTEMASVLKLPWRNTQSSTFLLVYVLWIQLCLHVRSLALLRSVVGFSLRKVLVNCLSTALFNSL
jgi:hypothetical protein